MTRSLRIGIDVGGTNTDAVLVDADGAVLAWAKVTTTADPADGIDAALERVIPADLGSLRSVALGTTHALNAVLQRRDLLQVAVLRVAAPATFSVPPFAGWPGDLHASVDAGTAIVRGGVEVDGRTHPIDPDEIRRALQECAGRASAVAVTGPFSLQDPSQELEVAAIARDALGLPVSMGHEVGGLGLLERENAAILNASLAGVANAVTDGFTRALAARGIAATPFLTQNDGTLMSLELARALPVRTIGSGPANSIRGAVALTGASEALVIDVGGTSTDVGAVTFGFPRESAAGVDLGGVRTNFRMPDVVSVAAGGGTVIGPDGSIGTRSVGAALEREALVFGGETPTLSDAAIAAGHAIFGDPARLSGRSWPQALVQAEARIADAVDRMKLAADDAVVVLVGGGSVILSDGLPGVSAILRPQHADVANAVGAAIALVSGEAEHVADVGKDRQGAIDACLSDARQRAQAAGADPSLLETVWVDEIPLAYMDVPISRIRAKVAGPPLA